MSTLTPERTSQTRTGPDLEELLSEDLPPCKMVSVELCPAHGVHYRGRCGQPSVVMATAVCPDHGTVETIPLCSECKALVEQGRAVMACTCGLDMKVTFH